MKHCTYRRWHDDTQTKQYLAFAFASASGEHLSNNNIHTQKKTHKKAQSHSVTVYQKFTARRYKQNAHKFTFTMKHNNANTFHKWNRAPESSIYILKIISGSEWSRSNASLDLCDTRRKKKKAAALHVWSRTQTWAKLLCGKSTITDVRILIANTLVQFNESTLIVYSSASDDVLSTRMRQIKKNGLNAIENSTVKYKCWKMSAIQTCSGLRFSQSIFVRTMSKICVGFHRRTS